MIMELAETVGLFALTAVAEIVGCYLPWLVLKQGKSAWLLLPTAASLAAFAWLQPVTCHRRPLDAARFGGLGYPHEGRADPA